MLPFFMIVNKRDRNLEDYEINFCEDIKKFNKLINFLIFIEFFNLLSLFLIFALFKIY